jgi:dipeptidyl aminopeptidase/acylaminoacyl peptidase
MLMRKFDTSLILSLFLLVPSLAAKSLNIEDFIASPDMLTAKVSPNGAYIATVWNFDDKRSVVTYKIEDSTVVAKFGGNIIRPYDVSWANDNKLLVKLLVPYNTDKVRRESESKKDFDINDYFMFGRIISSDVNGKEVVALMNDERSVKRNVNLARITHFLPDDPDHILMSANRRERLTLFKVNVNSGESERIAVGGRFTEAFINDSKGNLLFRYDYRPIAKTIEILKFKNDDDWDTIDTLYFDEDDEDKNKIDFRDLVGVKDDQLVYRKQNEETGFYELILNKQDKKDVLVSLPNTDIVSVITKGVDNEVIGYKTLTDVYRSHYFDAGRQTIYDKAADNFANENFYFSSTSKNQKYAVIKSWGSTNPLTFFTYDLVNDKLAKLNYPYSTLPSEKLASGFKVQYLARDKTLINAYLYLPPDYDGSKKLPLVVMPHGGPQSRNSLNYSDFTQFVATRGYIVVKPNFRGSSGYGKKFEQAGYKEWGGKMQEDLEDVVSFLAKENLIDTTKVCIVGASYGGYAALMGAVKTPDMFQCAVSINGVTHLPEQVDFDLDKFESDELQTYIKESIGDPDKDQKMLRDRSPALQAAKINVPILLIHGDEDKIVPYEQAEIMYEALEKHNKQVEFITLEETGHNFLRYREDIREVFDALERFLAESLKEKK